VAARTRLLPLAPLTMDLLRRQGRRLADEAALPQLATSRPSDRDRNEQTADDWSNDDDDEPSALYLCTRNTTTHSFNTTSSTRQTSRADE